MSSIEGKKGEVKMTPRNSIKRIKTQLTKARNQEGKHNVWYRVGA